MWRLPPTTSMASASKVFPSSKKRGRWCGACQETWGYVKSMQREVPCLCMSVKFYRSKKKGFMAGKGRSVPSQHTETYRWSLSRSSGQRKGKAQKERERRWVSKVPESCLSQVQSNLHPESSPMSMPCSGVCHVCRWSFLQF